MSEKGSNQTQANTFPPLSLILWQGEISLQKHRRESPGVQIRVCHDGTDRIPKKNFSSRIEEGALLLFSNSLSCIIPTPISRLKGGASFYPHFGIPSPSAACLLIPEIRNQALCVSPHAKTTQRHVGLGLAFSSLVQSIPLLLSYPSQGLSRGHGPFLRFIGEDHGLCVLEMDRNRCGQNAQITRKA